VLSGLCNRQVALPGDVIDKECPGRTSVIASCHRPERMTVLLPDFYYQTPIKPCIFFESHNTGIGIASKEK
jgi:hypothetical protein